MDQSTEKFTIRITAQGVVITGKEGNRLELTACEALMLLDVLNSEEDELKRMSEEASPLPMKIRF